MLPNVCADVDVAKICEGNIRREYFKVVQHCQSPNNTFAEASVGITTPKAMMALELQVEFRKLCTK